MKYENFETVKKLVNQIEKHQRILDCLDYTNVVLVKSINPDMIIYTIGASQTCEHEYQKQAEGIIEFIRLDLQNRIDNLKSQLAQL